MQDVPATLKALLQVTCRKADRMEYYLVLPRHMTASIYVSIWLCAYMELQRYVSLMSLFGAPSDPLFGAPSDPLFGAPSEPPTVGDMRT